LEFGWLVPATADALFETFVATAVVEALHGARTWDSFKLSPLGFGPRLLEATGSGVRATVSFDVSPGRAVERTVHGDYRWIFETYEGLDLAARRPDLTLHVEGSHEVAILFEVKATDANSQYGRDSIYKCLGYLKDFHELWNGHDPRVVLIFATGVSSAYPAGKRLQRDLFLTSDASLRQDLVLIVSQALARAEAGQASTS